MGVALEAMQRVKREKIANKLRMVEEAICFDLCSALRLESEVREGDADCWNEEWWKWRRVFIQRGGGGIEN